MATTTDGSEIPAAGDRVPAAAARTGLGPLASTVRLWAVGLNTFREAVRDKVLYGVLAFAGALLLFTLALAELSLNERERIVHDIGLASISLFAVVIAVFLGSSLLYKEIDRKTLYIILPRPLRRHEFVVGKFVGIAVTALVFIAIMGAIELWVLAVLAQAPWPLLASVVVLAAGVLALALVRARDRTAVLVPWSLALVLGGAGVAASAGVGLTPVLAALLLIFVEVLVVSAVALFFSAFSTPFLTGALTVGVWVVGRSADEMADMRSELLTDAMKAFLRGVARVVPNFHLFVPGRHLLSGEADLSGGVGAYLLSTVGYGVAYAALLLIAAAIVFRRRDLL